MYGDKETARLRRLAIVATIRRHPGVKQAEIARKIGVHRSMVSKDLRKLDKAGIRLYEDERRGLYIAGGAS